MLDDWRLTGADRVAPLRFARIAALQARATTRDGEARRLLDAKLGPLIEAYAREVAQADAISAADRPRGALGQLADATATRPRPGLLGDANYPELPSVDAFRSLWSTLRTRTQVRKSLAEAPTGAGPLNSAALAHRALTLMGGASPGYLQHFLSYVDTLSWLETLQDAGVLTGKETAPPVGAKPRAKPKPRKRS